MRDEKKTTVLVTGTGAMGVGEGVVKCLQLRKDKYHVIATNENHNAPMLFRADKGYVVPRASAAGYVKRLIKICADEHVVALIPGSEAELQVISQKRTIFESHGICLIVNTPEAIEIGSDKWRTYEFLDKNGFMVPKSCLHIGDGHFQREVGFPIIVKPLKGHGSIDVFTARDNEELIFFSRYLAKKGSTHLFQEYFGSPEREYTIGVLTDLRKNYLGSIVMKRLLLKGFSQFVTVTQDEIIADACRNVAMKLESTGPLNIQGRLTDKGFFVFEINPRFSGSAPFRALAGFNEAEILVDNFVHRKKVDYRIRKGLIGMRYLKEMCLEEEEMRSKVDGFL